MTVINRRAQIVATGKQLLSQGLVARTWGNVSARINETSFEITPSGRDYVTMQEEEIPVVDMATGQWEGECKPSGEWAVHAVAYETFQEVDFVIHTHQTYATALSLAGFGSISISAEERKRLGGVGVAAYGLPGQRKLAENVKEVLKQGRQVVLMAHHGVLICGASPEDALEKAKLLEEICMREVHGKVEAMPRGYSEETALDFLGYIRDYLPETRLVNTQEAVMVSSVGEPLVAQLDDMAQMVGEHVPIEVKIKKIVKSLKNCGAVIVPYCGIYVYADDEDDVDALEALMQKAAVAKNHTDSLGWQIRLSKKDCTLMHLVYKKSYAKRKKVRSDGDK